MPVTFTWLGQAGYLLEDGDTSVILDPYFSDSVSRIKPQFSRLVALPAGYLRPYDLLLFTHGHLDHADPQTVLPLMEQNPRLALAGPRSARDKIRQHRQPWQFSTMTPGGGMDLGNWRITALPAYHTDRWALGYLISSGDVRAYFTGDTVLTGQLMEDAPLDVTVMFTCINGSGNNMNGEDAVRLAKACHPQLLVPCHYGMFAEPVDVAAFENRAREAGINMQRWQCFSPVRYQ